MVLEDGSLLVDRFSNNIDDTSKSIGSDGHLNGSSRVRALLSTDETIGTFHGNGTDRVLTEMLSDLKDETLVSLGYFDLESVENLWELLVKLHVDNGSNDLRHLSDAV